MADNIKPFKLELNDGRILDNAVDLQEFIGTLSDKIVINAPDFEAAKTRYNKFAKFYNENIMDVWQLYK